MEFAEGNRIYAFCCALFVAICGARVYAMRCGASERPVSKRSDDAWRLWTKPYTHTTHFRRWIWVPFAFVLFLLVSQLILDSRAHTFAINRNDVKRTKMYRENAGEIERDRDANQLSIGRAKQKCGCRWRTHTQCSQSQTNKWLNWRTTGLVSCGRRRCRFYRACSPVCWCWNYYFRP